MIVDTSSGSMVVSPRKDSYQVTPVVFGKKLNDYGISIVAGPLLVEQHTIIGNRHAIRKVTHYFFVHCPNLGDGAYIVHLVDLSQDILLNSRNVYSLVPSTNQIFG